MNSMVRFALESREEFSLTLVYPKDMDGSADRISVLAPVGSALLGLTAGEHIEWPRPGGGKLKVRLMEVVYQPERDGEFHRQIAISICQWTLFRPRISVLLVSTNS